MIKVLQPPTESEAIASEDEDEETSEQHHDKIIQNKFRHVENVATKLLAPSTSKSHKRKRIMPNMPESPKYHISQLSYSGEDSDINNDDDDDNEGAIDSPEILSDDDDETPPVSKKSKQSFPKLNIIPQTDAERLEKLISISDDDNPVSQQTKEISSLIKKCESICTRQEQEFITTFLMPIANKRGGKILSEFLNLSTIHQQMTVALDSIKAWQNKCQLKVNDFQKKMANQEKIIDRQMQAAKCFIKSVEKNANTICTSFRAFVDKNKNYNACTKCSMHCLPVITQSFPHYAGKPATGGTSNSNKKNLKKPREKKVCPQ
jgi:hypothetical protein